MVKKRVIIVLLFYNGVLFRTKRFQPDYRYTANFVDAWSIDEVVMLDITRNNEGERENFYSVVSDFTQRCFVPLTVGGKVRNLDDIKKMLSIGADKVVLNSVLFEDPEIINSSTRMYGSQCIIGSIDVMRHEDGRYEVFSHNGSKPTGLDPVVWARELESRGVGEILVTSIERDGSLQGYDNVLNKQIADAVSIPVLVAGGAGKWQDFADGFEMGGASGVCTTNIYHFTETSIKSAKTFLKSKNFDVRS